MLDMDVIGWIVVGFIAGAISGRLLGGRTARGCLPNIVVGILGGGLGGWLASQLGMVQANGFIAAVLVALLGSLIIRLILNATNRGGR
ncbi:MAG: GlsB/YeaQ/YmgE family stress response membrane protein [Chloroflexi bacterium]|nr:GlsB/YeaQ/YmgE family stress response membrane protein [Chloroflexota bacterium]